MGETILLVDDEEGIRKVLGISLADMGYQVLTAENGDQGLLLFRNHCPPIVLTDIKMPGMDGIELLKRIKNENPDTEVIIISGHGDMDLAIKSLKYQATDFVTKPINDDILEIALTRAKERMTMRRALRQYTENLESMVREKSARLIRAERLVAVGQVVESLSSAFRSIAADLEGGITFFNDLPCYVSIHNRDLKIVAVNQLFAQRLGNQVGNHSWAAYTGRSAGPDGCPVGRTITTGRGQRSRETMINASGLDTPVVVHTAPIQSENKEVELVLEIAADVTETKRLQEELQATQAKYQQLFDEVPCYISVIDRNFKLTAVNKLFQKDFGSDTGIYCYAQFKGRQEPCDNCPVASTFDTGQSHQAEMIVTDRNGRNHHVLVTTAPIANTLGKISHVMEMSADITQIRALQDHLSSLGLLLGSVSHSIKGLLTGLDGGMYLVNSGLAKANFGQIEEGWGTVKLLVGRIRQMVLDILFYAKERELQWERVDALSFVHEVATLTRSKLQQRHIEYILDFEAGLGSLEIDAGVVRSALTNILENAVDACMDDGAKTDHRIIFRARSQEDHVIFEITDNGSGMDQETQQNLFTLFFSSKGQRGTGLGLYVSHKVIQQHGGSISVDSQPGQGSTFTITLPRNRIAPAGKHLEEE